MCVMVPKMCIKVPKMFVNVPKMCVRVPKMCVIVPKCVSWCQKCVSWCPKCASWCQKFASWCRKCVSLCPNPPISQSPKSPNPPIPQSPTESLQQTKFVYIAKKGRNDGLLQFCFCLFGSFLHMFRFFLAISLHFIAIFHIVALFWNIYRFCSLQWLSATNKKYASCSDSVQQAKQICFAVTQFEKQYWKDIQFPCDMWQRN